MGGGTPSEGSSRGTSKSDIQPTVPRGNATVSARAAYLRRVHQKLLAPGEPKPVEGVTDEEEGPHRNDEPPPDFQYACVFDGAAADYVSLSPYTADKSGRDADSGAMIQVRRPDDSDVLASVCKQWWRQQEDAPADSAAGLDEIRFKQIQEVEAVKRVFARQNKPIDSSVLERALIMPAHWVTGAGVTLKGGSSLPSNPFFRPLSKKA